jgi:hypothetical protein
MSSYYIPGCKNFLKHLSNPRKLMGSHSFGLTHIVVPVLKFVMLTILKLIKSLRYLVYHHLEVIYSEAYIWGCKARV